jgi:hypothetical protein
MAIEVDFTSLPSIQVQPKVEKLGHIRELLDQRLTALSVKREMFN